MRPDLGHLEGLLVLKEVRVPLALAACGRNLRGKPFTLTICPGFCSCVPTEEGKF